MNKRIKQLGVGTLLGILISGTIAIAFNDPIQEARDRDEKNWNTLQSIQFELRQLENKEKEALVTYCEDNAKTSALLLAESEEKTTKAQRKEWLRIKTRNCNNYYTDSLSKIYVDPSSLYFAFLKSEGTYISQSIRTHFYRNGYAATDISTSGRKLDVYAPSFMKAEGEDLERTYTVKLVSYPKTTGRSILLNWNENGVPMSFLLGHISKYYVEDGVTVKTGDKIALSGGFVGEEDQGVTTGPHLHFEYRIDGISAPYPSYLYSVHEEGNKTIIDEAKEDLGDGWRITTYYSPMVGQKKYFYGSYKKDFTVNASGNALITSSGHELVSEDAMKIIACPKEFKLGTKFEIDGNIVTCEDRGGAINDKHLDLWVGIGDQGYNNIGEGSSRNAHVYLIK